MIRSLAWRSVKARKGRAVLNGLGIVLGVALFFSVLSLSKTIVSTFDELFSAVYGKTDLIVAGSDSAGTVEEGLLSKVQKIDGVSETSAVVAGLISLKKDGEKPSQSDQVFVNGITEDDPDLTGTELIDGSDSLAGHTIQLDETWAKDQDIAVGEKVTFATPTGLREFTVGGIFKLGSGVEFGGQGFGAIDQQLAREILDIDNGYSEIDIELADGADLETVRKEIEGFVPDGIEVKTPSDVSDDINAQIQGFNIMLYFFAAASLFVGGFLILNSFNMTVAQRLREIGMLRTLGASRKIVRRIILFEAVLLGLIGSALGILFGLALTRLMVWLVSNVGFPMGSIKFAPEAFVIAPILGVLATVFGALRPAIRASRVPPIQAVLREHRAEPLRLKRRLIVGTMLIVLGMIGVFLLASSSDGNSGSVFAGVFGVLFLFSGVIMVGPVIVPPLIRTLAYPLRKITPIEGRMADDNARGNPVRTASTASGLMIGIALVAAIGTLGASFIGSISHDLDEELKTDFVVQPAGMTGGGPQQTIAQSSLEQIQALPQTGEAAGTRLLWLSEGFGSGWSAYGLDPETHATFTKSEYTAGTNAEIDAALARGEVTVPEGLAKGEKVAVGDTIELQGARGAKELKVAALQTGNSFEASSIVMSNDLFREIYGIDGYSSIQVIAKSEDQRAALGKELNALLAADYPNFEALSNEEIKQQITDQINQVFAIFYVIMAIAILVSLLGIVNTLLMNVFERTREIGVLRAIGSGRWQVRRMIIAESLLITTAGAAIGLIVGVALGYAFVKGISSSGQEANFHPPVAVFIAVAVLSVIFGVLAALLPARRAARMNVIEAVSYE